MIKKLLFVTNYSASTEIESIRELTGQNPGYAIQKFSRLLSIGFVKNGVEVNTLSIRAISRKISKKIFWKNYKCIEDGVNFFHAPFFNLPFLRQFGLFIYSFFSILRWCMTDRKEKVVFCDALTRSACLAALYACRITRVRCVGIVTDMPGMVTKKLGNKFIQHIVENINRGFIKNFDACVFITKYMNEVLNTKHKPFIIMEGSVDENMKDMQISSISKSATRDIIYAGCIHERHGLKLLVEAFTKLPQDDIRLILFGDGTFCKELNKYIAKDPRISFRGVVPNSEVVEAEQRATLLINPRPTHEDFVYYSFPSKNHEYMVTGTPVLTTKLPCIPEEYDPYLFYIEDVSIEGIYKSLMKVLSLSPKELQEKGKNCRSFVLAKKNNRYQAKRIIDLMNSI